MNFKEKTKRFFPSLPVHSRYSRGLLSVPVYPVKQRGIIHLSRCCAKSCFHHILVAAIHVDTIDLKESEHHIHADALVSIHKGMIGDECVAEAAPFSSFVG